jgi:hypothetical protein
MEALYCSERHAARLGAAQKRGLEALAVVDAESPSKLRYSIDSHKWHITMLQRSVDPTPVVASQLKRKQLAN